MTLKRHAHKMVRQPMMHSTKHLPYEPQRLAGVLLHPTSLPGRYGIGDLGDEVVQFLDWAASAGMRIWQVLPLNPPGYGDSPYGCVSSFAGNPMLIAPQRLLEDGLLDTTDVSELPEFAAGRVEFGRADNLKSDLLRRSWTHFRDRGSQEMRDAFEDFLAAPSQAGWLADYALYMALKQRTSGAPWWAWGKEIVAREEAAMRQARAANAEEIRFWSWVQFLFFRQWDVVREAARSRGIRIMGDVPIYVAGDSADVWGHRELFQLDDQGQPTVVAGVPPDYFSATGQRWGNPLYRWDAMRQTGYAWWIARIRMNLRFADVVRLDHFRGFAAYWEIPAAEETAIHGRWMPGPGAPLFEAIRDELGKLPLVAEDLGFITQDVHDLRNAFDLPGMKIVQFGFAQNDSPHLPHRFSTRTVAYTGTHDNDTARGWFEAASESEKETALTYLGCTQPDDIPWGLIRTVYTSVAETSIVPVQDILSLGGEARMNRPGEEKDNWSWRLEHGALTPELAARLHRLALLTGRV